MYSKDPSPLRLRIVVTTGDPAGVGPEIMYALTRDNAENLPLSARCDASADAPAPAVETELVLAGDRDLLRERMSLFGSDFELVDYDAKRFQRSGKGRISCLHVPLRAEAAPGRLDPKNAPYVLGTLDLAVAGCLDHSFDAMVTAPISKSAIAATGLPFTGHTEYLQEKAGAPEVVMMLGCAEMNVALVTTHLPLKDVADSITRDKLRNILLVLHADLKSRMGFADPEICVCGLNPHAGEDGVLGREEIEIISPVLEELRTKRGFRLKGPLPADTVFQPKHLESAAAVLAMYHDQGLPTLKYAGFDSGYNTTLGLPFIRTSVDHGTACDLAGSGTADFGSLVSAVSLAVHMAKHQRLNSIKATQES